MTGKDEWRLIHTNGSFLTDSLVTKPPAQNASNGLPGQGQTPGGGPLGANNMNTAPAAPTSAGYAIRVTRTPLPPCLRLNPHALTTAERSADFPLALASRSRDPSGAPGVGGANPFGANSAAYDPVDPRTWPAITLATPTAQPGQAQQPRPADNQARGNQPFGGNSRD